MLRTLLIVVIFAWHGAALQAGGVAKKGPGQKRPAPRKQIEPAYRVFPYTPRQDTLEVWQHYGVGPLGRMVPRVIVTRFGPLYSRNLEPYPWLHNRSTALMPMAVD
ncbi:MAG: hypothetical protein HYX68_23785 [Planctomycetes bacterium]|nr:hypothetical protein [Planctomycetota bacterium]